MSREKLLLELLDATRLSQDATHQIDDAVNRRLGINRTDGRCIDRLDVNGPMTAGELATATGLSPAAITAAVDRMEQRGYVKRRRDDADRRRVVLEATDAARDDSFALYGGMAERGTPELEKFSDDELRAIIRFLRISAEVQQDQAQWIRELPPEGA
jgi:DNA-binding MarR family transcriptional regulator